MPNPFGSPIIFFWDIPSQLLILNNTGRLCCCDKMLFYHFDDMKCGNDKTFTLTKASPFSQRVINYRNTQKNKLNTFIPGLFLNYCNIFFFTKFELKFKFLFGYVLER